MVISLLYERSIDGPCCKACRTLNNAHILRLGCQIGLLIGFIRIAFSGCHESGANLHTGSAQFYHAAHILMVHDTASSNHRDRNMMLFRKGTHIGHNLRQCLFQCLIGSVPQILQLEAQMTASKGTFHNHGIREAVVFFQPAGEYQTAGTGRGDNGDDAGFAAFHQLGKL